MVTLYTDKSLPLQQHCLLKEYPQNATFMLNFSEIDFRQHAISNFEHELTSDQTGALNNFISFLSENERHSIFVLSGYAGTGKSSLVAQLIKSLKIFKVKSRLLAPTGRAAKVFSSFANEPGFTIHKQIYFSGNEVEGNKPTLAKNLYKNTIFFVDECSMIAGFDFNEGSNLLEDLLNYVNSGENCKLVFMGDNGQLPPVGQEQSPVFSLDFWREHFPFVTIYHAALEQVVRTSEHSAILENATFIRSLDDYQTPLFCNVDGKEVIKITGLEVKEILEESYDKVGQEQTILLTMSNKRANKWNHEIRNSLLFREDILERGDRMMVVKNNYFWLDPLSDIGFIANGEIFTITRFVKQEVQYGFEFAHVRIQFLDTTDDKEYDVIILLEALTSEAPNVPRARLKELFFEIEKDFAHERNKRKRYQMILKNPYFNALQVKYANAITVHKSQGGQWENVFIDYGFIPEEMKTNGYLRWLYTAITRSSKKLFLVNFPEELME